MTSKNIQESSLLSEQQSSAVTASACCAYAPERPPTDLLLI